MSKKSLIKRWTDKDLARLLELAQQGATLLGATAALKRPQTSVQKKAREIGLHFAGPKELHAKMRKVEALQLAPRK